MTDWIPHLDRIATRVGQTIRHGIVTNIVNESGGLARVQISLSDIEVYNNIPFLQAYGIATSPTIGASAMLVCPSGDISQAYCTTTHDSRYRPINMQPGEVTIHDHMGNKVYLSQGPDGLLIQATTRVTVVAPDVIVNASGTITLNSPTVHATGTIIADVDVIAAGKSLVHHTHIDSKGGATSEPI